jgi:hypothetical protein
LKKVKIAAIIEISIVAAIFANILCSISLFMIPNKEDPLSPGCSP